LIKKREKKTFHFCLHGHLKRVIIVKYQVQKEHERAGRVDRVATDRFGQTIQNRRQAVQERDELDQITKVLFNFKRYLFENFNFNKSFLYETRYFS
jgi:hypothetical protein